VQLLGAHLVTLGQRLDSIYCGRLRRQRQTAEIVAAAYAQRHGVAPEIFVDERLDEYDAESLLRSYRRRDGAVTGDPHRDRKDFHRLLEKAMTAWVRGETDAAEVEPWTAFRARVTAAIDAIMQNEGASRSVLIASSAGVIGVAVGNVLRAADDPTMRLSWSLHNGSLTRLLYGLGRVSLSSFNALPHLGGPEHQALVTYR
jgi:broad specificity phosphatase PhoE